MRLFSVFSSGYRFIFRLVLFFVAAFSLSAAIMSLLYNPKALGLGEASFTSFAPYDMSSDIMEDICDESAASIPIDNPIPEIFEESTTLALDSEQREVSPKNSDNMNPAVDNTEAPPTPTEADGNNISKVPSFDGPLGEYGRLFIPDLGYSSKVSLQSNHMAGCGQDIVDAPDHSLLCTNTPNKVIGGLSLIADHDYQGFSCIAKAVPGLTMAYIKKPDGSIDTYVCSDIIYGHNTGEYIADSAYNMLTGDVNTLGMYTCAGNCEDVVVALWKRVY